jgi:hypothetical protein
MLHLILLVFAFVLFVLAGVGVSHPRVKLTEIGLALWVLSVLLGYWKL